MWIPWLTCVWDQEWKSIAKGLKTISPLNFLDALLNKNVTRAVGILHLVHVVDIIS